MGDGCSEGGGGCWQAELLLLLLLLLLDEALLEDVVVVLLLMWGRAADADRPPGSSLGAALEAAGAQPRGPLPTHFSTGNCKIIK